MMKQQIGVVLASEYPQMRSLLKEALEGEERTVIIGQADNARRTLNLARSLRPDLLVIDSSLPYVMGLDSVPLTRTGGLDVAQTIAEEMPNTGVVLLGTLDRAVISKSGWMGNGGVSFCRESLNNCVPTTLADLRKEVAPGNIIFARVEPKLEVESGLKTSGLFETSFLVGTICLVVGSLLIITLVLLIPGVILALTGLASLFFGAAGALLLRAFKRRKQVKPRCKENAIDKASLEAMFRIPDVK